MNQTKTTKRNVGRSSRIPRSSSLNPDFLRSAGDINRVPPFGGGPLLLADARRKPIETVCNLFDYGMDGSLITVWEEWMELAITSREENGYREGLDRARLIRFDGYFTQLIAAWIQLYIRITPEGLRPPLSLPANYPVKRRLSVSQEPEAMIRNFTKLYTRRESLQELWAVVDAVAGNPAASQSVRRNLLSNYEALACITEAAFGLFFVPGKPRQ